VCVFGFNALLCTYEIELVSELAHCAAADIQTCRYNLVLLRNFAYTQIKVSAEAGVSTQQQLHAAAAATTSIKSTKLVAVKLTIKQLHTQCTHSVTEYAAAPVSMHKLPI
jgi:hypothetical protein